MRNTEKFKREYFYHNIELLDLLTPKELLVLSYLPKGMKNREIAEKLGIKTMTVRNYITTILFKLSCKTRSEAAAFAAKNKIGLEIRILER